MPHEYFAREEQAFTKWSPFKSKSATLLHVIQQCIAEPPFRHAAGAQRGRDLLPRKIWYFRFCLVIIQTESEESRDIFRRMV
jgi:hypothetical protein